MTEIGGRSVRLAGLISLGLLLAIGIASTASARTLPTMMFVGDTLPPDVGAVHIFRHPGSLQFGAKDGTVSLRHLSWKGWGQATATAHGSAKSCLHPGREYVCRTRHVRLIANRQKPCEFDSNDHVYDQLVAIGVPNFSHRLKLPIEHGAC
jgi:hypothetical protein